MDYAERGGKQRPRPKVSWKFLTVLIVCIVNSILTVVLWTLLIPLREEVKTLQKHEVQDGVIGVKTGLLGFKDGVSGVLEFDDRYGFPVEDDSGEEVERSFDEHSSMDPQRTVIRVRRSKRWKKSGKRRGKKESGKKSAEKKSGIKESGKKSREKTKCKECKCSTQKHKERQPCKKCCNRKARSQAREQSEQLQNMQSNLTALNDMIQKILAKSSREENFFVEAHDKLYKSRLGQFVGSNTPKHGRVCLWQYAEWMSNDAKKLYQLDDLQGRVKVTMSGVYFIYGQLIQEDFDDYASASIVVSSGTNKPRPTAQCSETAGYKTARDSSTQKDTLVESIRTCYMGVLARLEAGAQVYIKLNTRTPRKTWHVAETAYLGLIKFS
ncbi:uncharacterized protein LOC135494619 isoform X2 [Lineus longissimus]|uniref:uncharacterized protein LOC135494619 isoform X2 n=1 Tax=Lineus longissimus TaxID=88925 RepID=UPI00315DF45D